jgi:3-dehydroquinate synthase
MPLLHQQFSVPFRYDVHFTSDLTHLQNPTLADFFNALPDEGFTRKLLVVIDAGVAEAHADFVEKLVAYLQLLVPQLATVATPLVVPGGEAAKNDPNCVEAIVAAIDKEGIDRHSFVMGIGGGAVLDLVGYAAAISHRGVKHIRVPTTVLSQNDSGVGVKNGVNYKGKKNFLGTFVPPVAVFNDSDFLTTLDDRDWRSGISEAFKVALIKDYSFFEWLEAQAPALARREMAPMEQLIFRCADLHMQHIRSGDPFESGSARPLDFGHWAAHKLEYLTQFNIRHGEAVAIGIALDTVYSYLAGRLPEEAMQRVLRALSTIGFELYDEQLGWNQKANLHKGLEEFREHLGGRLTITLLDGLGKGVEVHEMEAALINEAVDYLAHLHTPTSVR